MGNEKICQPMLFSQIKKKIENLGLDRDIKSGNGFIKDYQLRSDDKGKGDGNPLPLSSGKACRIALCIRRIKANLIKAFRNLPSQPR